MATALSPIEATKQIEGYLTGSMAQLEKACQKHLTPERLIQVVSTCVFKIPRLQECDRSSILSSVIQGSALGLSFDSALGEAYLIPRWNKKINGYECQFQPGYRGLVKLVRQTGQVSYIQARLVYQNDEFSVSYSPDLTFTHNPHLGSNRGPVTHVYSVAKLTSGEYLIEYMTVDEIEGIRLRSQYPNDGPWASDWGEMAKKTVLKRQSKTLPQSSELAAAIEADNREYPDLAFPRQIPANNSGHGKGMYASQEQTDAFVKAMTGYLEGRNQKWQDRWTRTDGVLVKGLKNDLVTKWQADNHLVKWAIETGRLDKSSATEDGIKNRQIGRFTAIIYHRSKADRIALTTELARYCDEQEQRQAELINRENADLFENDDSDVIDVQADDDFEDDAAFEERMKREQEAAV